MTRGRRWGQGLTLAGWQMLVLSVMGLAALGGAAAGTVLLNRTDAVTRELTDAIQPARIAAYQLQGALRDQETSVRGYAIAANVEFLTPFIEGQRAEQRAAADITARLGDRPESIADLAAIERAAATWRQSSVQPLIDTVVPGAPKITNIGVADRGKAEFDRLRALFDIQNSHLTAARNAALDELASARGLRDGVLLSIAGIFVAGAALLAYLMRRAVTRPLSALAASCRRIAGGNFTDSVAVSGPKDIRAIARDVDNMRQRIVAELGASLADRSRLRAQKQELDVQTVELRRSNAELEQFAYVASHDLQEPLRKVASFCQLLEKRYGHALDERGLQYLGFAVDGAERMQVLINDLLTFSRVGRVKATHQIVSLDDTVDAALSNLAIAIEESGALIVRPNRPLPDVVGDATLLTMLWQNLIGNAIKFRQHDRAPRIEIACRAGDGDGRWVISVTDNGIGIPPEFVAKVFVIFQRLHSRDSYTGTGIGLAICKKIVELHGGTIGIDTDVEHGTRFRFTLPTFAASDEATAGSIQGAQR